MRYIFYGIMAFLLQLLYLKAAVPMLLEAKSKPSGIKLRSPEGKEEIKATFYRIALLIMAASIISFFSLCLAGKLYGIPLRGNVLEYFALMGVFLLDLTALSLVICQITDEFVYFQQFLSLTNVLVFLTAGYAWPVYMMPQGFALLVKMAWPLIYVATPLKSLNLKGVGWGVILPNLVEGMAYSLFWSVLAIVLYHVKHLSRPVPVKSINEESGQI